MKAFFKTVVQHPGSVACGGCSVFSGVHEDKVPFLPWWLAVGMVAAGDARPETRLRC